MAETIKILDSKDAVAQLEKLSIALGKVEQDIENISKKALAMNQSLSSVKSINDLTTRVEALDSSQKKANVRMGEAEKLAKKVKISREQLALSISEENIELQKNRKRINEANKAARTLDSAYAKLSKRTLDAKKKAKDLGAQYGLTSKQFKKAQVEAQKLDRRIKKLDKAVGDNQRNVGNYPKIFGSATKAMGAFIGAFGIIEGLRIGVRFVKELGQLAVQMEGESRRAAIVFGESLAFVTEEAEKNAIALGLTRREFITAASATQDLLIPLGFQRKEASRLSVELTNLSGVLSNWVGGQKDAREVSEILTKSILGETEQIKTLGIKIDQTSPSFNRRVKQLQETNNLTREQARALEILNQITDKSADAQEEFAKATKSLAQQEAQANALFREQVEILANDLTPAYISWINAKTRLATVTGDLFVLLGSERTFVEKLQVAWNSLSLTGQALNRIQSEFDRLEIQRLIVAERAFQILIKTTDAAAARLLVNSLTIDQLRELIAAQEKSNETNEEAQLIIEGSILSIENIIKKNKELIKTTDDDTYRERLLQENQLLAQQIKLLLKVPEAVKAINAAGVGVITQEELERRRTAGRTTETAIGGAEPSEDELLDLSGRLAELSTQDFTTNILEEITDFVNEYDEQISKAIDITNSFFDNRIERIQQDIDENNRFFENQIRLAEGNDAEKVRLEAERQKKDAELQKKKQKEVQKQAIFNKAIRSTQIIIDTASGIVAALANLNIPLATAIGITGAAELATVLAAPIPQFAEGTKNAPGGVAVVGEGGEHEYIKDNQGNIFKTPASDTLVKFKGGEEVYKNADALLNSHPMIDIYKATVMTTLASENIMASKRVEKILDDNLKDLDKKITRGIHKGFRNVNIHNHNNMDLDYLQRINDLI